MCAPLRSPLGRNSAPAHLRDVIYDEHMKVVGLGAVAALAGCRIHFDEQHALEDAAIERSPPVTFGERATSDHRGVTSDTATNFAAPSWNYGASSVIGTYAPLAQRNYSLVRFELGALGPGATVLAAHLEIVTVDLGDTEPGSIEVRALAESWVEGTGDEKQAPGATWFDRDEGVPWDTPGGTVHPELVGELTPSTAHGQFAIVLEPSAVQRWIDAPATNHGLRLESPGTQTHYHFASSEAEPPEVRPQLVLELAP